MRHYVEQVHVMNTLNLEESGVDKQHNIFHISAQVQIVGSRYDRLNMAFLTSTNTYFG